MPTAAADAILGPNPFIGLRKRDVLATLGRIGSRIVAQPALAVEHEAALVRELVAIAAGKSRLAPATGDRRFVDPTWAGNPVYRRCLQAYLACSNAMDAFIACSSRDAKSKERARFLAASLASALAPTNALLGNPAAVKAAFETGGRSVAQGVANAVRDIRHNKGMPTQVDRSAFEVGKNLALSRGAVVFRNEVLS
jgi:poly[(R)-3-hydroxyalkanoate] polymerase subunit PhaC